MKYFVCGKEEVISSLKGLRGGEIGVGAEPGDLGQDGR